MLVISFGFKLLKFCARFQVLSRPQASISFCDGNFYIKDLGSSNGTFINNFRLSKAGATSDETMIFTDDILK